MTDVLYNEKFGIVGPNLGFTDKIRFHGHNL